jgi:predicted membrane metal-binding protein
VTSSLRGLPLAHLLLAALCSGIAAANLARSHSNLPAGLAVGSSLVAVLVPGGHRIVVVALTVVLLGWWWGSARLDAIDRSPLSKLIGTSETARVVVTAPPRRSSFSLRIQAEVERWGRMRLSEPVLLELPVGRAPAQGDVLTVLGVLAAPHGPRRGFDERTWLRRHGVHVVLRGDRWRVVGRRGGLGAVADTLRAFVTRGLSHGVDGEHRAVLLGVVLGADEGLSQGLRDRFRASGLYHLLRKLQVAFLGVVAPSGLRCSKRPERVEPTSQAPIRHQRTWMPNGTARAGGAVADRASNALSV